MISNLDYNKPKPYMVESSICGKVVYYDGYNGWTTKQAGARYGSGSLADRKVEKLQRQGIDCFVVEVAE